MKPQAMRVAVLVLRNHALVGEIILSYRDRIAIHLKCQYAGIVSRHPHHGFT